VDEAEPKRDSGPGAPDDKAKPAMDEQLAALASRRLDETISRRRSPLLRPIVGVPLAIVVVVAASVLLLSGSGPAHSSTGVTLPASGGVTTIPHHAHHHRHGKTRSKGHAHHRVTTTTRPRSTKTTATVVVSGTGYSPTTIPVTTRPTRPPSTTQPHGATPPPPTTRPPASTTTTTCVLLPGHTC
jgi:hypothetical protein